MDAQEFVSYNIAQRLKSIGFDIPCQFYYTKEDASDDEVWITSTGVVKNYNNSSKDCPFLIPVCSAPSYHTALEWIRNKYLIHCFAVVDDDACDLKRNDVWRGCKQRIDGGMAIPVDGLYHTWTDAIEASLHSAILQVS